MIEISIHPAAEADYEDALAWYLKRSPQAAEHFEAAFDEALQFKQAQPSMFPLCDNRHRSILLKRYPYTLIYRTDGEAIRVIAVAHTKRRSVYWSKRA